MGFSNYFKAKKPEPNKPINKPQSTGEGVFSEKHGAGASAQNDFALQVPSPNFGSSRASVTSSMFIDDIKHEVMVNYLYQQQCSHLWVADGSGDVEGVLLRKSRGNYMACPPRLADSAFAMACATLNVQVRRSPLVRDDCFPD